MWTDPSANARESSVAILPAMAGATQGADDMFASVLEAGLTHVSSQSVEGVPYAPRRYRREDEEAVLELLAEAFGTPPDPERWRWQVEGPPTGGSRSWVLERDRAAIAHAGLHVFASFVDGESHPTILLTDLAVRRKGRPGRFAELLASTFARLNSSELPLIIFPIDSLVRYAARRGFHDLGRIPQWVRWLKPAGFVASRGTRLARVLAPAVPPALAATARLGGGGRLRVEALVDPGAEVDELAAESARYARCIRTRDAAYLRWRWLEQPGSGWRLLAARDRDGGLRGVAAVGADPGAEHGGASLGRISDLLARDAAATTALLRAAVAELRRAGCSIAVLDYLDPRPWARSACRRAGFVERGIGPSIATGGTALPPSHPARWRESWYLTRGDSDLA